MAEKLNLNDPLNEFVAPKMGDNEALRRLLYLLNQQIAVMIDSGVVEGGSGAGANPLIIAGKDSDGHVHSLQVDHFGRLKTELIAADVVIGAVEIKNATTEDRVIIDTSGNIYCYDAAVAGFVEASRDKLIDILASIGAATDTAPTDSVDDASLIAFTKYIASLLESIDVGQGSSATSLSNIEADIENRLPVKGQAAMAGSLPVVLPSDQTVDVNLTNAIDFATETTLAAVNAKLPALETGNIPVVIKNAATISVEVSNNITGFATETTLAAVDTTLGDGSQKTQIVGASGDVVTVKVADPTSATETTASTNAVVGFSLLNAYNGALSQFERVRCAVTGVVTALTGFLNTLVHGRFLSTPPTLANGESHDLTLTNDARLRVDATVTGVATETGLTEVQTRIGATNEAAAASDTATSGLNGLLKLANQHLTTLIETNTPLASGIGQVTTSASGSLFTALSSQACKSLTLLNHTLYDIEFQLNGSGAAISVRSDMGFQVNGITNATQVSVRRRDQSGNQIVIQYNWLN